jgi:hypothetical protein
MGFAIDYTHNSTRRLLTTMAAGHSKQGIRWTSSPQGCVGGMGQTGYIEGELRYATAATTIGRLMELTADNGQIRQYQTANAPVVGVACETHSAAGWMACAMRGTMTCLLGTGSPSAGTAVKARTDGGVEAATLPTDNALVIGVTTGAVRVNPGGFPAGNYVDVQLKLGW